ncbi:MAG: hypothetical protein AAF804_20655 [Bacteroidota bacterium]
MNEVLKYSVSWLIYLFFQVFLFNYLVLFQVATPFVFLLFVLTLPFDLPKYILYPLAFFMGLCVDIFSENLATGLHAFSALLVIGLRPYLLSLIASSNVRNVTEISFASQTNIWVASFLFPLIFIHHLAYFLLEAMTFSNFLYTLWKVVASSIYTFLWTFLLAFIFYKR